MALTLRRNIIWALAGSGTYGACQWLILIILAHLGGAAAVGKFALSLAVTAPVMLLSNLALRQVLVSDAKGEYPFSDYIAIRSVTIIIGFLSIVAIALTGYKGEVAGIMIALGLAKSFESGSDILYGLQQRHERLDRVALSMIMRGGIGLMSFGLFYFLTGILLYGVLGLALAWLLVFFVFDVPQVLPFLKGVAGVNPVCKFDFESKKRFLRLIYLALPSGVATTLVSLNTNIPRYFIEYYLGEESLGIFASMAYLIVVGGMIVNSGWQASSPKLANYASVGDMNKFTQLLKKLVFIAFFLGGLGIIVAMLFGKTLLVLLYGAEISKESGLFVLVMIGASVSYISMCLGSALLPLRLFRQQLVLMVLVVLINGGACYLLVPEHGLAGAVYGWGGALVVYTLLSLFIVMRAVRLRKFTLSFS